MKGTKRDKLLKKRIKRRSYGAVLVSKLIPCLMIGAALSAAACFVIYKISAPLMHETNTSQQYFLENNLVSEYDRYNGENYEQRVINTLYSYSSYNTFANQEAYELFDAESGQRLMRSEFIGQACVHTGKENTQPPDYYYCDTSSFREPFERFEKWYDEYRYDPGSVLGMSFDDFYVRDDGTFLPGKGTTSLTTFSSSGFFGEDNNSNSDDKTVVLDTFDLTPSDTSGMTHCTTGESMFTFANLVGEPGDSIAISLLDEHRDYLDSMSHSSVHSELDFGQSFSVFRTKLALPNGKNYYLYTSYFTDSSAYIKRLFLIVCGAVTALSVIVALLRAYSTYMKEQTHFAMEDYRRDMTNTMAHDLKTPLMAISGAAENMKNITDEEKRMHYADMILSNVDYMNGIIGSVLELAKTEQITRTKKEPVDLKALTEKSAARYSDVIEEKGITLTVEGEGTVKADSSMMGQAVENLISNAVKYTTKGGSINVSISGKEYTVENDSHEVSDKTAEELWKPFVKGDNSRSAKLGSGLGLSIVKNICENQGFTPTLKKGGGKFAVTIKFR